MSSANLSDVQERLQKLAPEQLTLVNLFINDLLNRTSHPNTIFFESFETMSASEALLKRDWERTEEDEAWASL